MYEINETNEYCMVDFTPEAGVMDEKEVELLFLKIEGTSKDYVIFNFSHLDKIGPKQMRPFSIGVKTLKDNHKCVFSVKMQKCLRTQLSDSGVFDLFNFFEKEEEVFKVLDCENPFSKNDKQSKAKLDVKFINPFLKATVNTFGIQANTEITIGTPIRKDDSYKPRIALAGIIGITSKAFTGSLAICFPKEVFLLVYNNMLGSKETEINQDMEDAAGEFTNIILGQAKAELNSEHGYEIGKSIPSIISGDRVDIQHFSNHFSVVVPLSTSAGDFYLDICIEK